MSGLAAGSLAEYSLVLGCELGAKARFVYRVRVLLGFVAAELSLLFDWELNDCLAFLGAAIIKLGLAIVALDK